MRAAILPDRAFQQGFWCETAVSASFADPSWIRYHLPEMCESAHASCALQHGWDNLLPHPCRHMPHIASESFDAVIDKGTLDAILCATSSFDHVPSTLLECARCERAVLAP